MPSKKTLEPPKKSVKKADDPDQKKLNPGKGIRPAAKKLEESKSQERLSKQQVRFLNIHVQKITSSEFFLGTIAKIVKGARGSRSTSGYMTVILFSVKS